MTFGPCLCGDPACGRCFVQPVRYPEAADSDLDPDDWQPPWFVVAARIELAPEHRPSRSANGRYTVGTLVTDDPAGLAEQPAIAEVTVLAEHPSRAEATADARQRLGAPA